MELKTYADLRVTPLQVTPEPHKMLSLALRITQKQDLGSDAPAITRGLCRYLLEADHTSVLEHVVYTFLITGVSRSFMAQITRHRMASPTCGSQHYQEYDEYPCVVHPRMVDDETVREVAEVSLSNSFGEYSYLTNQAGVPKEEARQLLPNAAAVNILWTINARSLVNFLNLRLCYRNVMEMQNFAEHVRRIALAHFTELFANVGPQCYMDKCRQGRMRCKHGPWVSQYERLAVGKAAPEGGGDEAPA